eukprot:gene12396-12184_t
MSQTATILVIDDEPQIRKFLRISLASQGYKVLEAGTGTEGLAQAQQAALAFGPLTVDLAYRRVLLDGSEVALTRKEYAVLAQLARHPGRVITQQQLLKDIWGPTHTEDTHYLRIVVGHLRQKLADDPMQPRFIVTEAGVGYRLLNEGGF